MNRTHRQRLFRRLEIVFWCAAIVLLGCYGWVYLDREVYQAYQTWSFERALQHEPAPVLGFVLHSLRFGDSGEEKSAESSRAFSGLTKPNRPERLAEGSVIGQIEIPRVGVDSIVVESTTDSCLRRAVGHIEGTALPGHPGNIALAGHRDTFFRGLRKIQQNDVIYLRTLQGNYEYVVDSTRVVEPDDVSVLAASSTPTLTLVTCYPFDYIGSAPHRYIVQARQVAGPAATQQPQGS